MIWENAESWSLPSKTRWKGNLSPAGIIEAGARSAHRILSMREGG